MSILACCDSNSNGTFVKLHFKCRIKKCNCQKQLTFTPKQFQLESTGFRNKMQNYYKETQNVWEKILKPAINVAAPFIGLAAAVKSENPKVSRATTNNLYSISGQILNLTDMQGSGLHLKVM